MEQNKANTTQVTRFEVIDEEGRVYTNYNCKVVLSYQDDGKTLKAFITTKTNNNMKTKTSILAVTKVFFILLVSCCLFSCSTETEPKTEIKNGITYEVTVIDGCEYILGSDNGAYNGGYFLSHKGNCKNTIHYQNKVTVIDTVEYQLISK